MKKITFFKTLLVSMAFIAGTFNASGQTTIAGWDFSAQAGGTGVFGTSPLTVATKDANVTVGSLTRGSGFGTLAGSGAAAAWGATNFSASGTLAGEITANKFFSFTITANAGYKVSLAGISAYNIRHSSTGPTAGQWQYQIGTGNFVNIGSAITWGTGTSSSGNAEPAIDLSGISDLQNVLETSTITIRLVSYGASATGGTLYLKDLGNTTTNDLIITGTIIKNETTGIDIIKTTNTYASNGAITFSASANQTIDVYNAVGQKLLSKKAIEGVNTIPVSANGVVIVKVGNSITKVSL